MNLNLKTLPSRLGEERPHIVWEADRNSSLKSRENEIVYYSQYSSKVKRLRLLAVALFSSCS